MLISIVTYFILDYIKKENETKYLNETTKNYANVYSIVKKQKKELADIIFSGILSITKVSDKLSDISSKNENEKNLIRRDLYIQAYNRFVSLQEKDVSNIVFVLPNKELFLDMKNPLKHTYQLDKKSIVLNKVIDTNKSYDSFEVVSNSSGFRYSHPIIRNDELICVIEITFNEYSIAKAIMNQYGVLCNFILKKDEFEDSFLKTSPIYTTAHVEQFVHNKKILKKIEERSQKSINDFKPRTYTSIKLYTQGLTNEIKSFYIEEKDKIATIIPLIHNINNQNMGFISILTKGVSISTLNNNFFTFLVLFISLYAILIFSLFQQRVRILMEKKNLRENMKKDKQLIEQAKLAQMGEMIGNIAHQWRQPLSAVSTVASGVKLNHEYKMLDINELPKQMDLILENTRYLSNTIDTFRNFVKDNKTEKNIVIQDNIKECLKIVSASIKSNHIKIIEEINYFDLIEFKMISGELSQAIINLLNNAKDAIVQNKITDAWIKISLENNDDNIKIIIEDNAGGIKEDILPKIFEPYFTTKHQFQGTGLGLYMSKIIVENHLRGRLKAKNTKDGARFTIELNTNP